MNKFFFMQRKQYRNILYTLSTIKISARSILQIQKFLYSMVAFSRPIAKLLLCQHSTLVLKVGANHVWLLQNLVCWTHQISRKFLWQFVGWGVIRDWRYFDFVALLAERHKHWFDEPTVLTGLLKIIFSRENSRIEKQLKLCQNGKHLIKLFVN